MAKTEKLKVIKSIEDVASDYAKLKAAEKSLKKQIEALNAQIKSEMKRQDVTEAIFGDYKFDLITPESSPKFNVERAIEVLGKDILNPFYDAAVPASPRLNFKPVDKNLAEEEDLVSNG